MRVCFWGTRGSLPSSLTSEAVKTKIVKVLTLARQRRLDDDDALLAFVEHDLPFALRGTYGGNTSCVEIRGGTGQVLCDAGSGLRDFATSVMQRQKAGLLKPPHEFHLFLSHPHWDHIQGFPFFTPAFIPGNKIHIYGCHEGLRDVFVRQQELPFFPVPLAVMRAEITFTRLEPGKTQEIAGFQVTPIRQNHPGDSYGYSFIRDGKKIVYSTDSEHKGDAEQADYPFLDFFRNADLLIFDAQYTLLDAIHVKENWGHSSNLMAVELAVRSDVKRLCLYHNEHTCDDEALDRFLEGTRKYLRLHAEDSPMAIDLAYDGLEIEV